MEKLFHRSFELGEDMTDLQIESPSTNGIITTGAGATVLTSLGLVDMAVYTHHVDDPYGLK